MTEFLKLHTIEEAWQIFLAEFEPSPVFETCRTSGALDRILARDAVAPHDLPTFVRSTVDGYAVSATDTHGASSGMPAYLDVVAEVPMGQRSTLKLASGQAALAHTGGMVPDGADAVVMLEQTQVAGGPMFGSRALQDDYEAHSIEVYRPVAHGENCVQRGDDVRSGELVLAAGHMLQPQDIGGLLAVGITELQVVRQPRVGIVSQGDEIVSPETEPGPGQVRDINSYTLACLVRRAGGIPINYPIAPDRQDRLDAIVRSAFDETDMVVITAGSSVSYRDLTARSIDALGQPGVLVHGVAVRPGKPTILAICAGKPVIGLPGNPVSCINIFQCFATPIIRRLMGASPLPERTVPARLTRNIPAASGRADFVRVRVAEQASELVATPVFGQSNLIYVLIRSDGVVEVPLNSNGIPAGSLVQVRLD